MDIFLIKCKSIVKTGIETLTIFFFQHTTRNMYTPTKIGDTVKILQLLSLGYSPIQKFTEAENGTPLHVAASEGHVLTSHVLVQAGAELDAIDDDQATPLMLACTKGRPNIVRYERELFNLADSDMLLCRIFKVMFQS